MSIKKAKAVETASEEGEGENKNLRQEIEKMKITLYKLTIDLVQQNL